MATHPKKTTLEKEGERKLDDIVENTGDGGGQLAEQGSRDLQVYDFGEDEAKGIDNVTAEEYRLPFFRVLDPKSPQVAPPENGGIKRVDDQESRPGDIYITTTKTVIPGGKKGFVWVPVYRHEDFIEWIPRDPKTGTGGGFVGIHAPSDALIGDLRKAQGKFGKLKMASGNEIAQTYSVYGLMAPYIIGSEFEFDFENMMPGIIAYASTQISKYNSFVGKYMNMKYANPKNPKELRLPPVWAHRWHCGTQMDPPKAGNTWYGWTIGLERNKDYSEKDKREAINLPGSPLYLAGKQMYEMIIEQVYKVDFNQARGAEETDTTQENGKGDAYEGTVTSRSHDIPQGGQADDPPM